ncbi:MAG: DUF1624 domain-containing protein [Sphingomonadaceae bacterium]|nr:DUF1624 domain-containing protein [Sphingomonadaceae bacterium]
MSDGAHSPSAVANGRIDGFDLARAIAIFGMITVNFRAVLASGETPRWLHLIAEQVNGRAAALFVFLAGVGIALLSARSRASGDRAAIRADRLTLFKRALFLFAIGLGFRQIWEFDILHFYGVYLLAAALLLTASSGFLAALGIALTALFPVLYFVVPSRLGIPFWDTTSAFTARDIAIDLFFQGYHPVAPWLAFLLAGTIVGRLDLADRALRRRLLIGGVALALTAEAIAAGLLDLGWLKAGFDIAPAATVEAAAEGFSTEPYPPMPLFVAAGLGWALAAIALCLAIGERFAGRAWLAPLVHAGQLALTIYIVHGTLGVWALAWLGLGGARGLGFVLAYSALFYAAAVLLATLWRRRFARGPVEMAMRWLTGSRRSEILPEGAPAA